GVETKGRPGVAGKHVAMLGASGPGLAEAEPPPGVDTAQVVVKTVNVQYQVFRCRRRRLFTQHAAVGLVHTVAADSEVAHGFAEMGRQVLLPGFAIADL